MMTLRYCQPLTVVLVMVSAIVTSAFSESEFLSKPKIEESDGPVEFPTSALKPLQVVDCVLEKCMWLSRAKDKRLCTYLLCLGGSRSLATTLHARDLDIGSPDRSRAALAPELDAGDYPEISGSYPGSEMTSPDNMPRSKKWQYPDPLQHCVQTRCTGQRGVDFYTCVYNNCIAGKMTMSFMAV